ncbi:MAG: hypothetical protein EAY68_00075 [Bacteroidetes bacterium]|nr:MAG: hypothetical protein EAY68_00075 [Bacteroidota bacterium]
MKLVPLKQFPIDKAASTQKIWNEYDAILGELAFKNISEAVVTEINTHTAELNAADGASKGFTRLVFKKKAVVLQLLLKQHKIVPAGYYKQIMSLLGFSGIGLPIGAAIGTFTGNMGLLGVGLPFGMIIGFLMGKRLDAKAAEEGRQIQISHK